MQFSTFLKSLLRQFVEGYEKYFSKTFKTALIWTIICFAIAQLLAAYTDYDSHSPLHPTSILSFFATRFSYRNTYSYVDLTKTVFIFFAAIFSINMLRKITVKDVIYLAIVLVVSVILDCALFRVKCQLSDTINNKQLYTWIYSLIFLLRIYLPLILFALIIQVCTSKVEFNFHGLLYLFVSLWLFNEAAYEILVFFKNTVFALITSPFDNETYRYAIESILGIPLVASFFIGYYTSMTVPFKLSKEVRE